MSLLVVLIALGLRQAGLGRDIAAGLSRLVRRWRDGWAAHGAREGWHDGVTLGFIVLPPFLLVLAVVVALYDVFYGLPLSAVALLVMLPVLLDRSGPGPGTLAREQEAWFAADEKTGNLLADADPRAIEAAAASELARARKALLAEQLREIFAPLFWFLLLTPVAAVAYFFLRVAAEPEQQPSAEAARKLLYYAEWPVARVLALSFALAGDFVATWQLWRRQALDRELDAVVLLDESAAIAETTDLHFTPEALPGALLSGALAAVAALLHRALVIWVVLLALHTLWP